MQKEGQRRSNKASYLFLNTAHNVLLTPLFIFIFLLHNFIIFPPPTPPPHLFCTFFLPPPPAPHFHCFPPLPPPNFYCFLPYHRHHHHISIVSLHHHHISIVSTTKGQKVDFLCLYNRGTQRGYSSKPLNISLLNVF